MKSIKYINRPRAASKSTMLIHAAYITGSPILVANEGQVNQLFDMARKMGIEDIDIFTVNEWITHRVANNYRGRGVLIDEITDIIPKALQMYLDTDIIAGTMTVPMDEVSNESLASK